MTSDLQTWPAPTDDRVFEDLCLDLWEDIWGPDCGARTNGRSGQKQKGVDVHGRDRHGRWIGVQCKVRNAQLGSKLTPDEVKAEVQAAIQFSPPLSLYIVATTALPDAAPLGMARELTDQSPFEVQIWSWQEIMRELGRRPDLLRRISPKYWPTLVGWIEGPKILIENLPRVTGVLVGREERLKQLDEAWDDPAIHVVTLVAWGGVGKTALLAEWEGRLAARAFDGADAFDWSFYSQGTKEEVSASGDRFLEAAFGFFGGKEGEEIAARPIAAEEKGKALAGFVARRKALVVLDGLEPLQYPPSSPLHGEIRDPGVRALLKALAVRNPGLCVVTTRERVEDLGRYRNTTAPEWELERLSTEAGVALLDRLGVVGRTIDLKGLVEDVDGHALTINLLGTYLAKAHHGDVRKRHRVKLQKADAKVQGGHAFRAIEAYERWFLTEGEEGARQLAILRLLGLFDRPADGGCVKALRQEPAIPELTDAIVGLDEEDWNFAVDALTGCGLLSASTDGKPGRCAGLDAHPLIREYFAEQLKRKSPEAWRSAHGRLFEHLRDTTPYQPDKLEGLRPLYEAVAHGCHAGRQQEACDEVYFKRILRGTGPDGFYSVNMLGAVGADLGALASFFEPPWHHVTEAILESDQSWLLNEAGQRLRSLGRLVEALDPIQAGLEMEVRRRDWTEAARRATNLSEVLLAVGDIERALESSSACTEFSDRGEDVTLRSALRTTRADILHQAGRLDEAAILFADAERIQRLWNPAFPILYSLWGFRFCEFLLGDVERKASQKGITENSTGILKVVREVELRAAQTLGWVVPQNWLLDVALDHLTLGRAALYQSILLDTDPATAKPEIESALDGLRRAGILDYLPKALLTRSWLHFEMGNPEAAQADLAEAQEIAERGPMPLILADIALYRGRMFGDRGELAKARRLIEKHGYGRRLGELEDAEASLAP